MLSIRGSERILVQKFGRGRGFAIAVAHYAACAIAITVGLLGTFSGLMAWVFDVETRGSGESTVLAWIMIGGIFLGELIYRPRLKVAAGFGFLALLLLSSSIAANVLIMLTF